MPPKQQSSENFALFLTLQTATVKGYKTYLTAANILNGAIIKYTSSFLVVVVCFAVVVAVVVVFVLVVVVVVVVVVQSIWYVILSFIP